jgi:hypothetical protein
MLIDSMKFRQARISLADSHVVAMAPVYRICQTVAGECYC